LSLAGGRPHPAWNGLSPFTVTRWPLRAGIPHRPVPEAALEERLLHVLVASP
jgi:hypothetical protein